MTDAKTFDKLAIDAVKKVSPSVVSVAVSKYLPRMRDIGPAELFDPFMLNDAEDGAGQKVKIGGGSGFVVHADGLILTNKHVVFDTDAEYSVVLNDGSEHPAKVLSRDPINDIAVLKIDAKGLPALELASSKDIELGQTVIAIGNALGLFSNTVSRGIVSGLARSISASLGGAPDALMENLRGVIQTDVAINQGNSGGPLIDLDGRVVGINTAVIFGAQNIGFAIPIDWAKSDLKDIIEHGRIIKPFLGLTYVMLTPEIAKRYGLPRDHGAMVIRDRRPGAEAVLAGSPAHKAGLKEHDIVTKLDGKELEAGADLMDLLQKYKVGESVKLTFLRRDHEHDCEVTLEERK
ncbi:MAG TPA: trypsin-like peptidase domain-containing protein [Candidatus Paceibacterota bacterium]|nr:trypsin-like peptidase domain-containing protein [Candidatus Paceibacterota bacterium]